MEWVAVESATKVLHQGTKGGGIHAGRDERQNECQVARFRAGKEIRQEKAQAHRFHVRAGDEIPASAPHHREPSTSGRYLRQGCPAVDTPLAVEQEPEDFSHEGLALCPHQPA